MPASRVAVVVLNYHSTGQTVEAVLAVGSSQELDLRIVVVDNDVPGPDHEQLRAALAGAGLAVGAGPDSSVRLVASGGNLGYAAGNNIGIGAARAWSPEYIWLLNPDIRVAPGTLGGLLALFRAAPDAGAVGARVVLGGSEPVLVWSDGGTVDPVTGAAGNLHMGRPEAATPPSGIHAVDYVYGGCLLFRTAVLDTVGPLPEEYFMYFEETDWCRRVAAHGWRLLVDTRVRVVTTERAGGGMIAPHYLYYMSRNRIAFSRGLGVDARAALTVFRASFLRPWRDRVAAADPDWLPTFDDLVALAATDAADGVTGRRPEVESVPRPRSAAGTTDVAA